MAEQPQPTTRKAESAFLCSKYKIHVTKHINSKYKNISYKRNENENNFSVQSTEKIQITIDFDAACSAKYMHHESSSDLLRCTVCCKYFLPYSVCFVR